MEQPVMSFDQKAILGKSDEQRSLFVSSDPTMKLIQNRIVKVAKMPAQMNVLITGETGVGKEKLARLLHRESDRAEAPFIVANCAAIPKDLFESEFFGYVKGAFTGATANSIGFFGQAHGGTILLDEIGEMPLLLQAKLLRVVQEQEIARVGEGKPRKIDVRIIAATHVDLEQAVEEGTFREDLYYRLSAATIHVPPLRERAADVPALAAHLLQRICGTLRWKVQMRLAPETIACLQAYPFPGNVRELGHALSSAIVESEDEWILPEHLPRKMQRIRPKAMTVQQTAATLKREVERERMRWALEQTAGNQTRAAPLLNMSLRTFVTKLETHRFPRPKKSTKHAGRPKA